MSKTLSNFEVAFRSMPTQDLNEIVSLIKKEKERRDFEKTSQISMGIIKKLQAELNEVMSPIQDYCDNRFVSVILPMNIQYCIEDMTVHAEAQSPSAHEMDAIAEEASEELQTSKFVKNKVARIQKKLDKLNDQIIQLAKKYSVTENQIWEMVDPEGIFS